MMKIVCLLLTALIHISAALRRFDGDKVLTLFPTTERHLNILNELEAKSPAIDFWQPEDAAGVLIGNRVDLHVPRSILQDISHALQSENLPYETKIENLQDLIRNQFDVTEKFSDEYDYNVYHTYDEIQQWVEDMASTYPGLAEQTSLTTSTMGRDVAMLTMGTSFSNPIFLIDCGVHAREWISPAVCQHFVHKMLSEYGSDADVTRMMDKLTWVIIPLLNVDGYDYTWTDDRLWRKTRSVTPGSDCVGVDANRNFDKNWSGEGASTNPCSNTYCGTSVESEPIVRALSDIIRDNRGNIRGYIAFHSYGQKFVFPYSYDYKNTSNVDQLFDVSARAVQAVKETTGKVYSYGPGHSTLYLVSGGSKDMAIDTGVPLSYTIELRDEGRFGFLLPQSQIQGTWDEMWQTMIILADEAIATKMP